MKSCKVCEKPAHCKDLCRLHYERQRTGVPLNAPIKITNKDRLCLNKACPKDAKSKGYCWSCLGKIEKYNDPNYEQESNKFCYVCEKEYEKIIKGLCSAHYSRLRSGKNLYAAIKLNNAGKKCKVEDCDKNAYARLHCTNHYQKLLRWGESLTPPEKIIQKRKTENGYIVWFDRESIHASKAGVVYEHRSVMGEKIGRPLMEHETVHHKNGVRDDNRIENLELWSKSQPYGQRVKDKIKWAQEILDTYQDLSDEMLE